MADEMNANEMNANENFAKLIEAISNDPEQLAALEQEIEAPVEKGPGQVRTINFEDTIKSLANKYNISINDKDIQDMKGMLGNFNNLSQSDALSLNGAQSSGDSEDPAKGLLSSLFGGGSNSLFGNTSGSLFSGANSGQNVTLTQNQLQQLLNNASANSSLTNSSALGGLSSLLGGSSASGLLGGGSSLLGAGASILSKLFLVYLFMKLLRGGASMIL